MRNKEQFKAYVYAKAETAQAKGRKRRRLICSGIAACSVCICVVSAVFLAPHSQMDASNEMVENAFYAGAMPETEATEACRQDTLDFSAEAGAAGGTEAAPAEEDTTADVDTDDFLYACGTPAMKSCLFSVSDSSALTSNSLVRTAFYEIIEDEKKADETTAFENAGSNGSDSGRKDVRIAVTAYYLKKPEISNIAIDYSGDAVTVTVFADAEPIAFGSYVYHFTETLDGRKYFGQPIQLEFKHTSDKDNLKNTK